MSSLLAFIIATISMQLMSKHRFHEDKHAVALTYWLELGGTPIPQNEAIDFAWFSIDRLPPPRAFGFGQNLVVAECLDRLQQLT